MKKLTEKEWVEAFEEIHDRKPSPEEFIEGMRNGEFDIANLQTKSSIESKSTFGALRSLSEVSSTYKQVLYIVLVFFALILLFIVIQANRVTFDESHFEDGAWVVMGMEQTDGVNTVHYISGTWGELYDTSDEDDWFEYESLEEFNDLQELEEKPVKLPKVERIKQEIEHTTGLENINANHFMVISKGDVHLIFYWLNKDRAAVYNPKLDQVYVTQKLNTDMKTSGEYRVSDFVFIDNEEEKDEKLQEEIVLDFDANVRRSTDDEVNFGILSLQEFMEVYQLAGGRLEDIKDLEEVNQTIQQFGYQVRALNNADIVFFDSAYDVLNPSPAAWTGLLALPVERGKKLLLTTTVSRTYFEQFAGKGKLEGAKLEDVLKFSRMVILLEKE